MNKLRKALVAVFTALFLVCSALFAVACDSNTADVVPETPGSETTVPSTPAEPDSSAPSGPSAPDEDGPSKGSAYRVSVQVNDSGLGEYTLTSSENGEYAEGSEVILTVKPKAGYEATVKVNGEPAPAPLEDNVYKIKVTRDTDISVTYSWKYRVETYVAKGKGIINVAPASSADGKYQEGDSATVSFTADAGYVLGKVVVNGTTVDSSEIEGGQYTFEVTGTMYVSAEFDAVYSLSVVDYGSDAYTAAKYAVEVNGESYTEELSFVEGETVTVTVTAEDGYVVKGVALNTVVQTLSDENSFTFSVTGNSVIEVKTVALHKVSLTNEEEGGTAAVYAGGTAIDPADPVEEGTTLRLVVTANKYYTATVTVNGEEVDLVYGVYTFTVEGDTEISVTYTLSAFTVKLTANSLSYGSVEIVDGNPENLYEANSTITVKATPALGYAVESIRIGSNDYADISDYPGYGECTFNYTVTGNVSIHVTFAQAGPQKVTLENDSASGTAYLEGYDADTQPEGNVYTFKLGATATLTVEPNGAKLVYVSINGGDKENVFGGTYTFAVTGAMTVKVSYEEGEKLGSDFNATIGTQEVQDVTYQQAEGAEVPALTVKSDGTLTFKGEEVAVAAFTDEATGETQYVFDQDDTTYTMQWYNGLVGGILMVTEGAPEAQPATVMLLAASEPNTYYYYQEKPDVALPETAAKYYLAGEDVLTFDFETKTLTYGDLTAKLVAVVTTEDATTHYLFLAADGAYDVIFAGQNLTLQNAQFSAAVLPEEFIADSYTLAHADAQLEGTTLKVDASGRLFINDTEVLVRVAEWGDGYEFTYNENTYTLSWYYSVSGGILQLMVSVNYEPSYAYYYAPIAEFTMDDALTNTYKGTDGNKLVINAAEKSVTLNDAPVENLMKANDTTYLFFVDGAPYIMVCGETEDVVKVNGTDYLGAYHFTNGTPIEGQAETFNYIDKWVPFFESYTDFPSLEIQKGEAWDKLLIGETDTDYSKLDAYDADAVFTLNGATYTLMHSEMDNVLVIKKMVVKTYDDGMESEEVEKEFYFYRKGTQPPAVPTEFNGTWKSSGHDDLVINEEGITYGGAEYKLVVLGEQGAENSRSFSICPADGTSVQFTLFADDGYMTTYDWETYTYVVYRQEALYNSDDFADKEGKNFTPHVLRGVWEYTAVKTVYSGPDDLEGESRYFFRATLYVYADRIVLFDYWNAVSYEVTLSEAVNAEQFSLDFNDSYGGSLALDLTFDGENLTVTDPGWMSDMGEGWSFTRVFSPEFTYSLSIEEKDGSGTISTTEGETVTPPEEQYVENESVVIYITAPQGLKIKSVVVTIDGADLELVDGAPADSVTVNVDFTADVKIVVTYVAVYTITLSEESQSAAEIVYPDGVNYFENGDVKLKINALQDGYTITSVKVEGTDRELSPDAEGFYTVTVNGSNIVLVVEVAALPTFTNPAFSQNGNKVMLDLSVKDGTKEMLAGAVLVLDEGKEYANPTVADNGNKISFDISALAATDGTYSIKIKLGNSVIDVVEGFSALTQVYGEKQFALNVEEHKLTVSAAEKSVTNFHNGGYDTTGTINFYFFPKGYNEEALRGIKLLAGETAIDIKGDCNPNLFGGAMILYFDLTAVTETGEYPLKLQVGGDAYDIKNATGCNFSALCVKDGYAYTVITNADGQVTLKVAEADQKFVVTLTTNTVAGCSAKLTKEDGSEVQSGSEVAINTKLTLTLTLADNCKAEVNVTGGKKEGSGTSYTITITEATTIDVQFSELEEVVKQNINLLRPVDDSANVNEMYDDGYFTIYVSEADFNTLKGWKENGTLVKVLVDDRDTPYAYEGTGFLLVGPQTAGYAININIDGVTKTNHNDSYTLHWMNAYGQELATTVVTFKSTTVTPTEYTIEVQEKDAVEGCSYTLTKGDNETVASGSTVAKDTELTLKLTLPEGYTATVTVNGAPQTAGGDNSYTIKVTAETQIVITYHAPGTAGEINIQNDGEDAATKGWIYWKDDPVKETEVKLSEEDGNVTIHAVFNSQGSSSAWGFQIFYNNSDSYTVGKRYTITTTITSKNGCTIMLCGKEVTLTANEPMSFSQTFDYDFHTENVTDYNYGISLFDLQVRLTANTDYDLTFANIKWEEAAAAQKGASVGTPSDKAIVQSGKNDDAKQDDGFMLWWVGDVSWNCGDPVDMQGSTNEKPIPDGTYTNGKVAFTYSGGSVNYSVQLFYNNTKLESMKQYFLHLTVKSTQNITISVNGKSVTLQAGVAQTLDVLFVHGSATGDGSPMYGVDIQFPGTENAGLGADATIGIEVSDVEWYKVVGEEYENDPAEKTITFDKAYLEKDGAYVWYVLEVSVTGYTQNILEETVLFNNDTSFNADHVSVLADGKYAIYYDIATLSAGKFYPHLKIEGANWDNVNGDVKCTFDSEKGAVVDGDKHYTMDNEFSMPIVNVQIFDIDYKEAKVEAADGKAYLVLTFTSGYTAEQIKTFSIVDGNKTEITVDEAKSTINAEGESTLYFDITSLTHADSWYWLHLKINGETYSGAENGNLLVTDTTNVSTASVRGGHSSFNLGKNEGNQLYIVIEEGFVNAKLVQESDKVYYVLEAYYADFTLDDYKTAVLYGDDGQPQYQVVQDKVVAQGQDENLVYLLYFDITTTESAALFYPHMKFTVSGQEQNKGNVECPFDPETETLTYNKVKYTLSEHYNMPCFTITVISDNDFTVTKVVLTDDGSNVYIEISGTYKGDKNAVEEMLRTSHLDLQNNPHPADGFWGGNETDQAGKTVDPNRNTWDMFTGFPRDVTWEGDTWTLKITVTIGTDGITASESQSEWTVGAFTLHLKHGENDPEAGDIKVSVDIAEDGQTVTVGNYTYTLRNKYGDDDGTSYWGAVSLSIVEKEPTPQTTYSVKFSGGDDNSVTDLPGEETVAEGNSVTLSSTPKKDNYKFLYWYYLKGEEEVQVEGSIVPSDVAALDDDGDPTSVTLYPKFQFDVTIGTADNQKGYELTAAYTETLNKGDLVSFSGTMTSLATENFYAPYLFLYSGDTPWGNFRADWCVNYGSVVGQPNDVTVDTENFTVTKYAGPSWTYWKDTLKNANVTLTFDWTRDEVIYVSFYFVGPLSTNTMTYSVKATEGNVLKDSYTIGVNCEGSYVVLNNRFEDMQHAHEYADGVCVICGAVQPASEVTDGAAPEQPISWTESESFNTRHWTQSGFTKGSKVVIYGTQTKKDDRDGAHSILAEIDTGDNSKSITLRTDNFGWYFSGFENRLEDGKKAVWIKDPNGITHFFDTDKLIQIENACNYRVVFDWTGSNIVVKIALTATDGDLVGYRYVQEYTIDVTGFETVDIRVGSELAAGTVDRVVTTAAQA